MSLILDALKKAEQDRHAGQAPVIDEMLVRRAPQAARQRRGQQQELVLVGAIAAALLFAIVGIVYWLWPEPSSTTTEPVQVTAATSAAASPPAPVVAQEAPASSMRVDPERLQPATSEVPELLADTEGAQAMTMDELDGDAPQTSPSRPPREAAPPSPRAVPPSAVEPIPQPAAPVQTEVATTPITQPAPAPAAAPTPPPQTENLVRPLKDMPASFRADMPKLTVDVHVYDANPLRRFALINGKKYRETDTLLDGPRLVEIRPDGVVVEHRGSKVLIELPG